jgi:hypothetical protein
MLGLAWYLLSAEDLHRTARTPLRLMPCSQKATSPWRHFPWSSRRFTYSRSSNFGLGESGQSRQFLVQPQKIDDDVRVPRSHRPGLPRGHRRIIGPIVIQGDGRGRGWVSQIALDRVVVGNLGDVKFEVDGVPWIRPGIEHLHRGRVGSPEIQGTR